MSERRIILNFNTAITGVNENDGKFVSDVHDRQVMPLRGLLMQVDGVCGCHIARYYIEVKFLTGVTDEATVIEAIKTAVATASEREGLFPLRGNKTPSVIIPEPTPQTPPTVIKLTAYFGGRVVRFRANGENVPSFEQETAKLVDAIADHEGIMSVKLIMDGVYVYILTRLTTVEAVKAHVTAVIEYAASHYRSIPGENYFPFIRPGTLVITDWSETDER